MARVPFPFQWLESHFHSNGKSPISIPMARVSFPFKWQESYFHSNSKSLISIPMAKVSFAFQFFNYQVHSLQPFLTPNCTVLCNEVHMIFLYQFNDFVALSRLLHSAVAGVPTLFVFCFLSLNYRGSSYAVPFYCCPWYIAVHL